MISALDRHLVGEGAHRRLWEVLGPQAESDGRVRFTVWAPNARRIRVVGDWNRWAGEPLEHLGPSGLWSAAVAARPGDHYKFEIDGADGRIRLKADPMARRTECPPGDASIVPSFEPARWTDGEWMMRRGAVVVGDAPLRIYEVHLGSWRDGVDDWRSLAESLGGHVADLGFTHVELLPVAEHPYGGSWGYQVSGYYAPTARFGEPAGFAAFVDHLHALGIGVIIDWVPAHFPRDDWALGRFDGTALYEHHDPRRGEHPDWGTYVFNLGRHEVRNFLVANALYWCEMFHVDGLRVDAVASMLYLDYSRGPDGWEPNIYGGREDLDALAFVRELNTVVGEEFPDVMMIAEESTAWPGVTRPVSQGGLGFTLKWNLGWMHDTLGYLGRDPVHRSHHHSDLTFTMLYAHHENFVLPLSHDEVVHGKGSLVRKMYGDEWQKFANLRALLAWQWAMPGAPLIFMGTELAPWDEWDAGGSLAWDLAAVAPHAGVGTLIRDLNAVAEAWPALWSRDRDPTGFQWLDADDAAHSTYSFIRWDREGAAAVICVANLTPVPRPGFRVGAPWGGTWTLLVDTDAPRYSGSGYRTGAGTHDGAGNTVVAGDEPWQGQGRSIVLDLPPLAMVMFGATAPPPPSR